MVGYTRKRSDTPELAATGVAFDGNQLLNLLTMSETKTAETTANQTEVGKEQPKESRAFFQMIDEGDGVRFIIDTNGAELIRAFAMLFVQKPEIAAIIKFAQREAISIRGEKVFDNLLNEIKQEVEASEKPDESAEANGSN